ncbi:hypothetical protein V6N13_018037 [Hibiscus sabdariffa]|uniref:Uncharacterized protein n=1 Tax=Hibiscus sabdariffa TaxID=183260 RepID=A0ABR2CID8_9ROSI
MSGKPVEDLAGASGRKGHQGPRQNSPAQEKMVRSLPAGGVAISRIGCRMLDQTSNSSMHLSVKILKPIAIALSARERRDCQAPIFAMKSSRGSWPSWILSGVSASSFDMVNE